MRFHSHTPGPPLSDFVERFWLCSDAPAHQRERIVPSGTFELVINLHEDEIRVYRDAHSDRCSRYSGAVFSGPYSEFFVIDPRQHASIMGVHFWPGGAVPFLGVPARELTDSHLDLESLWGSSAAELRERLCTASTPRERFSVLERALMARLRGVSGIHDGVLIALDAFERSGGTARVQDVAKIVGLSQRRLIQVFFDEVGLKPKLYCRVQRFQRALESARKIAEPDWSSVAARYGYFDQSHLIRDFQTFSGFSPTKCLHRQGERLLLNHVAQLG